MIRLDFTYKGIEIQFYGNGVGVEPDDTPTAILFRDGESSGVPVTVAPTTDTGRFLASFTTLGGAQGWASSDHLALRVTAIYLDVAYSTISFDSFSQFTNEDTAGILLLLSRLTSSRALNLDNLNAAIAHPSIDTD